MTQKAIIVKSPKQAILATDNPIPSLRDDYILVKNVAVALNPTDWKHVDFLAPRGVTVGCDYAGIVEEVGPKVKKEFRKGDRICGFVHGSNAVQPEDGAFAERIVAKGDVQMHIPDNLSFQEAATLGVGIITVGQGLYQSLKLAWPTEPLKEPVPLLIYGGSTATGSLAIQFAKLSGYTVWTTCSPHNFPMVKKLGADHVFDYKAPNAASEIRTLTNNNLKLAFDTISVESSAQFCGDALSSDGGEYSNLLSAKVPYKNVKSRSTLGYTALGEAFDFGSTPIPERPQDKEFAEKWIPVAERLLAEGRIRPHPPCQRSGGLQGVLDGMQEMREGKVSGEKLVYNVDDK
ncbi:oxidoreductase [Aspergillus sclerotialis]|uniref:Oxidoreductase n=1 Tax=Aspergillus sclerotialis TaxID=2070753 RepID=A0A3A3A632_9EURO|nr:oxidoreductase [Aspergillus sclerotialis]